MSKNVIIGGIKTTKHEHVGGVVAYSVEGLTEKEVNTLYLALCDVYNKVNCRVLADSQYTRFNGYLTCKNNPEKIIIEKTRINMAEALKK